VARIGILGAGALGLYFGGRLAAAGAQVRLLARGDLATLQERGTVVLLDDAGRHELGPVGAFGRSGEIGPVELVLVALKATVAADLPGLLQPLLGPDTAVLTIQNGLGTDELLGRLVGPERVMGGLAFMAVTRTAPGEVRCFHPGSVSIGELGRPPIARTHETAELLTCAGIRTQVVERLDEARWRKLVWNIPFNGLAVAEGAITTDLICADPALAARVRALMAEVQRAAAAFGYLIPTEFVERQFHVTPGMGAYQPSSLVDFLAGREVEVEAIWGEPLRRATQAGVAMPGLAALYRQLQQLSGRGGA